MLGGHLFFSLTRRRTDVGSPREVSARRSSLDVSVTARMTTTIAKVNDYASDIDD
jgi:hypothetical protein